MMQQDDYEVNEDQLIQQCNKYNWQDTKDTKLPSSTIYSFKPQSYQQQSYIRLRFALTHQENSERVFALTSVILCFNLNNYYALMLRKDSRPVNLDMLSELKFVNCLLNLNSKQYQLWNYKKELINEKYPKGQINEQSAKVLEIEDKFIEHILTTEDTKNYHTWDFRNFLTKHFSRYQSQLKVTDQLLFKWSQAEWAQQIPEGSQITNLWLQCNSLWSYRYNMLKKFCEQDKDLLKEEVNKITEFIEKNLMNQSAWNYLSGLYQLLLSNKIGNQLDKFATKISNNSSNRFALNFLLLNGQKSTKIDVLNRLVEIDPTRNLYYQYELCNLNTSDKK